MKRYCKFAVIFLLILLFAGCGGEKDGYIDATQYGVRPENSGPENSRNLQALIDKLSETGGTIYIPAGEYTFAENGTQTIGSHCIRMRSNVSIVGSGMDTVLKPTGRSEYGMDMFYFNDLLDTGEAVYLENCSFSNFVIDGAETSCETYTSAGKGFMFNLFRNCHWMGVTVKYTDATGFGVDCPLDSSIFGCSAIGCGKAATAESSGASGFGIGYGYADGERIEISGCTATDNRKFGFFFEHQGRFNDRLYTGGRDADLRITECSAQGNLYDFGGIRAENMVFTACSSQKPLESGLYFEDCGNAKVESCSFLCAGGYTLKTKGSVQGLILIHNQCEKNSFSLSPDTAISRDEGNSWNVR